MTRTNESDYMKEFGDRLRKARKAKGMSMDELAEMAGYGNRSSIACIETGKRGVPTDKAFLLAEILGVSEYYLITGKDGPDVLIETGTKKHQASKKIKELMDESARKHGVITIEVSNLNKSNVNRAEIYKKIKKAEKMVNLRSNGLTDEEMILINAFRKMSQEEKETIMNLVKVFAKSNKKAKR